MEIKKRIKTYLRIKMSVFFLFCSNNCTTKNKTIKYKNIFDDSTIDSAGLIAHPIDKTEKTEKHNKLISGIEISV